MDEIAQRNCKKPKEFVRVCILLLYLSGGFTLYENGHSIASIATLSVYDRWGNLVWQKQNFAPNDPALGWDGRFKGQPVLPGVYTWQAQLSLKDGSYQTIKGDLMEIMTMADDYDDGDDDGGWR